MPWLDDIAGSDLPPWARGGSLPWEGVKMTPIGRSNREREEQAQGASQNPFRPTPLRLKACPYVQHKPQAMGNGRAGGQQPGTYAIHLVHQHWILAEKDP